MKKEDQLRKKADTITDIIQRARQYSFDSFNMLNTESASTFSIVNRNPFLQRVRISLWISCVLELSKLYGSRSDDYRLAKLIEELINDRKENGLEIIKTEMESLAVIKKINNLKQLRDQHYAHKDENPQNNIYDIKFYYADIDDLLLLAEKIIINIESNIFKIKYIHPPIDNVNIKTLLSNLEEFYKLKGAK